MLAGTMSHPDQIELRRSAVSGSPFRNPFDRVSLAKRFIPSQGVSGSRQNAWQYVYPVNVVWMKRIVSETIGTDRGCRRRDG